MSVREMKWFQDSGTGSGQDLAAFEELQPLVRKQTFPFFSLFFFNLSIYLLNFGIINSTLVLKAS